MKSLRVLIVEDSEDDADLLLRELRRGGFDVSFRRVHTADSMRDALTRDVWDLVVSDYSMPTFSGLDALAALQASGVEIPFIIVSGTIGEDTAVAAMQAGAHDFLLKTRLSRLIPAIERELREQAVRNARRSAEGALVRSEARFRRLAESGIIGIVVAKNTGEVTEANDAFLEMVGYSRDELNAGGVNRVNLTPPEWQHVSATASADLQANGVVRPWEKEYTRKDGTRVSVLVASATIDEAHNISISADISERKYAERALRRSEERYRRIIETTNEGVWMIDPQTNTTFMNARMTSLLGYDADDVVGMSCFDFVDGESRSALANNLARRGGVGQTEVKLKRKDGAAVWVLLDSTPMFDAGGRYEGSLAMAMDVTQRKRLEDQLRQTQKMDAVGGLAGGIAHDFNNFLSVILSYATLILDDLKPSDPIRSDIEEIKKAGERAADLTRQLLAFGRQQMLQPRVVDLNQIVGGMEKMLRRVVGEDVELSLLTFHGLGTIHADPGQMEQVIMNLVVNARDALPMGGKVSIETDNVELDEAYAADHLGVTAGPHVLLAVTDTGTGMDAATCARIFEPFFTTKAKGKGTGLGLSTVFGIVQQTGGNIWVYSEPGVGTTFKMYFARTAGERTSDPSPPAPTVPSSLRGTETILLVEDEEQVRAISRSILRRQGYNVLEAQNGGEAFLICEQYKAKIHLLLTDVVMPRMSGRELAERLRPQRPEMKVLYVSGYTENSIVHHGVLDSGVSFLQKPITPSALLRSVREVLDVVAK